MKKNINKKRRDIAKKMATKVQLKWRPIAVIVLVCALLFVTIDKVKTKILYSNLFVIEEIVIKGNSLASTEEILGDAEIVYETPFFALDNKLIEKNVLRNNRIKRAIVTKKIPNVVEIFVEEKKSIALVTLDKTYELAKDGSLMKLKVRENDLPFITGFMSKELLTETEIDLYRNEMLKIAELLNELENIDKHFLEEFSEIRLVNGCDYIAYLRNGITKVLFGNNDLYNKGINLYSLLKSHKSELNSYNEIDLRYNNLAYAR